ncbi:MAG: glycosyltransferase family 39 protein [Desulfarculaceae bacterium]|nr:glycosyltransferase family 39 protein [Desulfarculaceae bacterium]MCF8073107.1 glycosyltransferase family 39 protein [Desulfarculaceae bacterium]MCF8101808.1 glycosyltransferase family 39 protein [Desulfarculaceae bacterium]MCF8117372.1 glycosyltransferase family 39 protein [Desulfarculaceae bacterium]
MLRTEHWFNNKALLLLMLAVLVLRLGTLWVAFPHHPHAFENADSEGYYHPAESILLNGTFAEHAHQPYRAELLRTPGYPLFIAFSYALFGVKQLPMLSLQVLLSMVLFPLIYAITARLWNRRAAFWACLLFAVEPVNFFLSQYLMSETLFTVLFTLVAFEGLRLTDAPPERRARWAVALGFTLALSALVRPISYYFIIPLLLWLIFWARGRHLAGRTVLKLLFCVFLSWLVITGAWQARNYWVSGSATFSQVTADNLLFYRAAGTIATREGISRREARDRLVKQVEAEADPAWTRPQVYDYYRRLGLKIILDDPKSFIQASAKGVGVLLLYPVEVGMFYVWGSKEGQHGPIGGLWTLPWKEYKAQYFGPRWDVWAVTVGTALLLGLIYLGVAAALPATLRRGDAAWGHALIWLMLIYLIPLSAWPWLGARFRGVMMPLFMPYAAYGLWRLWMLLRGNKTGA